MFLLLICMIELWIDINCKFEYMFSIYVKILLLYLLKLWVIILHAYRFKIVWTLNFSLIYFMFEYKLNIFNH